MQFVWGHVKETFKSLCPASLLSYLYFNLDASKFSVNLIHKGLEFHHDMVIPKESDPRHCIPGLTIVVHLCVGDNVYNPGLRSLPPHLETEPDTEPEVQHRHFYEVQARTC